MPTICCPQARQDDRGLCGHRPSAAVLCSIGAQDAGKETKQSPSTKMNPHQVLANAHQYHQPDLKPQGGHGCPPPVHGARHCDRGQVCRLRTRGAPCQGALARGAHHRHAHEHTRARRAHRAQPRTGRQGRCFGIGLVKNQKLRSNYSSFSPRLFTSSSSL